MPTMTPTFIPVVSMTADLAAPEPDEALFATYLANIIDASDGASIRLNAFLGTCDRLHPEICVEYSYLVFFSIFADSKSVVSPTNDNQRLPTIRDILAITFLDELSPYAYQQLNEIAYQALGRSFFDPESGGCRYRTLENDFECSYSNIIAWLFTTQHWRDAVIMEDMDGDGQFEVRINLQRLVGVSRSNIARQSFNSGYLAWDRQPVDAIFANLDQWRTGQGPTVPSRWGNSVIDAGFTTYAAPPGVIGYYLTHSYRYSQRSFYTFNQNNRYGDNRDTESGVPDGIILTPICTLVSAITTSSISLPLGYCQ